MVLTTCCFAVVVIVAALAVGGTGLATGSARIRDRLQARQAIRRVWTTRICDVGDGGNFKLTGTAVTSDCDLRGPFSGRRCVAYELTLFDFDGIRPKLLARVAFAQPFTLRDASGVAHVVPEPARIGIEPDKRWRFEPKRHDARLIALLERHCPDQRWRDRTVVVCEGVIALGGPVSIYGHATREPDPEAGEAPYRTVGTRPLVTGSLGEPLLLVGDEA